MDSRFVPIASALLFCALSLGCQPKLLTLKGASTRPAAEVATLRTWGNTSFVTEVDGEKVSPMYNTRVQLPPGRHDVYVTYQSAPAAPAGGTGFSGSLSVNPLPHTLTFEMLAGHEYEVGYPTIWIGRQPYVKDVTAKKNLVDYLIDGKPAKK